MDKKKVIKFMINVLPIVLVQLVLNVNVSNNIRTCKKLQMLQVKLLQKTSAAISNTASDVKEYVGDKKQDFENKRELKGFAREHDHTY